MGNSPLHQFHTRERKYILVITVVVCVCLTPPLPCFFFEDGGMLRFVAVFSLAALDSVCDCCFCCPCSVRGVYVSACTWFPSVGVFVCQQTTIRGVYVFS